MGTSQRPNRPRLFGDAEIELGWQARRNFPLRVDSGHPGGRRAGTKSYGRPHAFIYPRASIYIE